MHQRHDGLKSSLYASWVAEQVQQTRQLPDQCLQLSFFIFYFYFVITSGIRTPGSRFYFDRLDTLADFVCIHQHILEVLDCSYNCMWLTCGSFQLTHTSRDDTLFNRPFSYKKEGMTLNI